MTWESQPIPGGWEFTNGTGRILVDYIYPAGRGLEAWVECRVGDGEIPIASGRRDLTTADAATPFLRVIPEADRDSWAEGLRQAFYTVISADREGAPTIDLMTIDSRPLTFLVDPLVEQGGNTRLIAPGGSGKSLFAMAIVLTVATGDHRFLGLAAAKTGPVLYLDWETDEWTHRRRISALCKPLGIPEPGRDLIHYRPERAPLSRGIQAVSRAVRTSGAVMLAVDSSKMAAGPSGQSSGEESTLSLFMALRELGLPAVVVDHKSKEDIKAGRRGGYGNVFNENLARLQWEFTHYNSTTREFVLELTKENNVGARPALGFKLVTESDDEGLTSAQFKQVSAEAVRLADDQGVGDRIDSLFTTSTEPMPVRRIAELTGVSQAAVRAYFNRAGGRYYNVNEGKAGAAGRWRPKEEFLPGAYDDGIQDPLEPPPDDVQVF